MGIEVLFGFQFYCGLFIENGNGLWKFYGNQIVEALKEAKSHAKVVNLVDGLTVARRLVNHLLFCPFQVLD